VLHREAVLLAPGLPDASLRVPPHGPEPVVPLHPPEHLHAALPVPVLEPYQRLVGPDARGHDVEVLVVAVPVLHHDVLGLGVPHLGHEPPGNLLEFVRLKTPILVSKGEGNVVNRLLHVQALTPHHPELMGELPGRLRELHPELMGELPGRLREQGLLGDDLWVVLLCQDVVQEAAEAVAAEVLGNHAKGSRRLVPMAFTTDRTSVIAVASCPKDGSSPSRMLQ